VNTSDAQSVCSNAASKVLAPGVAAWSDTKSVTVTITAPPIPNPPTNLTVAADATAFEIKANSLGVLVASRVGVVKQGTPCVSAERKTAGGVIYTRVAREDVDIVNFSTGNVWVPLVYAKCS
jgi:hypothetical protein